MSIQTVTCYVTYCDICNEAQEVEGYIGHFSTAVKAQEAAEDADWRFWHGHVWCSNCVAQGRGTGGEGMTLREVHQRDEHDDCPVCQEKVRALVEAARQALPLLHICAGMTEESAEAAGIVVPALCAALAPFRGGQP